ncbi:hypothetical protein EJ06DRAFT_557229 [Trichodelitschia bisporula]|uniref:Uncharacterized protein n=1 Tax=Trichodelitschia bisporula TaxID=703511 RepID=A0A6G1HTJ1_9PEZI|nr:hypothetical protein EJ06DRAFT_557229 [Trichodelitschia bisporula]
MFFAYILLFFTLALAGPTALLSGPAWCTYQTSGHGGANHQITKDCCAAGYAGPLDNTVDHGQFAKCCAKRGGGSHGVKPGRAPLSAPP